MGLGLGNFNSGRIITAVSKCSGRLILSVVTLCMHPPVLKRSPAIGVPQQLLVPLFVGRLAAETGPVVAAAALPSSFSSVALGLVRTLLVLLLQLLRPPDEAAVRAVPLKVGPVGNSTE